LNEDKDVKIKIKGKAKCLGGRWWMVFSRIVGIVLWFKLLKRRLEMRIYCDYVRYQLIAKKKKEI